MASFNAKDFNKNVENFNQRKLAEEKEREEHNRIGYYDNIYNEICNIIIDRLKEISLAGGSCLYVEFGDTPYDRDCYECDGDHVTVHDTSKLNHDMINNGIPWHISLKYDSCFVSQDLKFIVLKMNKFNIDIIKKFCSENGFNMDFVAQTKPKYHIYTPFCSSDCIYHGKLYRIVPSISRYNTNSENIKLSPKSTIKNLSLIFVYLCFWLGLLVLAYNIIKSIFF